MFSNQRPVMAEILYSPAVRLICRILMSCMDWPILATIRSNGESKSTPMVTKHAVSMSGERGGFQITSRVPIVYRTMEALSRVGSTGTILQTLNSP